MVYTLKRKLVPAGLKNNPNRSLRSLDYITIHCTGNYAATATAASHALYQYNGSGGNQVSWHYTADKDEVWQSFLDAQMCWHAGDGSGPGNSTSIGIEICVNSRAGFQQACDNAALLTADLLKKYNLSLDRVVQHAKWAIKNCPAELRAGTWGIDWNGFLARVKKYLEGDDIMQEYLVISTGNDLGLAHILAFALRCYVMDVALWTPTTFPAKTVYKVGGIGQAGTILLAGSNRFETLDIVCAEIKKIRGK